MTVAAQFCVRADSHSSIENLAEFERLAGLEPDRGNNETAVCRDRRLELEIQVDPEIAAWWVGEICVKYTDAVSDWKVKR